MAAAEGSANFPPELIAIGVGPGDVAEIANEAMFACPQPWFLCLYNVGMSMVMSATVIGAFFFLLAAPGEDSPKCYGFEGRWMRIACTTTVLCFWTYPVVCCLSVVLLYGKLMLDSRLYYEFLLHRVFLLYDEDWPCKSPLVVFLFVYAALAIASLGWVCASKGIGLHVYSSMAYLMPVLSFLVTLATQWSVVVQLAPLPTFTARYDWALDMLSRGRPCHIQDLHDAYMRTERLTDMKTPLPTAQFIALVMRFVEAPAKGREDNAGAEKGPPQPMMPRKSCLSPQPSMGSSSASPRHSSEHRANFDVCFNKATASEKALRSSLRLYWVARFFCSSHLRDTRATSFHRWWCVYLVYGICAALLALLFCSAAAVTCLETQRVLETSQHPWLHSLHLRPDLAAALRSGAASKALEHKQSFDKHKHYFVHKFGAVVHHHHRRLPRDPFKARNMTADEKASGPGAAGPDVNASLNTTRSTGSGISARRRRRSSHTSHRQLPSLTAALAHYVVADDEVVDAADAPDVHATHVANAMSRIGPSLSSRHARVQRHRGLYQHQQ